MGFGLARQCSGNRCLAPLDSVDSGPNPRGRAGRANSKKDLVTGRIRVFVPFRGNSKKYLLTGPIRGLCALQGKCCTSTPSIPAFGVMATRKDGNS